MSGDSILLIGGVIAFLLYLWWRMKKDKKAPVQKKRTIISQYKGWMVTWMSNHDMFKDVRGHNAMRIVFGIANVYNDGYVESIPDTFFMTYHVSDGDGMQRKFNPFYDQMLLRMYQAEQGGVPVKFADGTDEYIAFLFGGGRGVGEKPQEIAQDVMSMAGM